VTEPPEPEPGPDAEPGRRRLDPHRAAVSAGAPPRPVVRPVVDTRRYQWMVGIFGLALLLAFSVYLAVKNGISSPGIAAGGRLHDFVAPLATRHIDRPANANPRCNPLRPNPAALNVCSRTPLVLDFFVTGAGDCVRAVDALQQVSRSRQFRDIRFAAVAVRGKSSDTTALVRAHRWTIPVAVDQDGRIGDVYGVEICPMIELARPGGRVAARLIGPQWKDPQRLAAAVHRYLAATR
jgi:hypothetical protein